MLRMNKHIFAGLLSLALLLALGSPASAQWRHRDRGLSTGAKVGIIAGSTAAGAVIGGLLGGKKGAIIGGAIGAGGGTGVVIYKNKHDNDHWNHYREGGYPYYRDSYNGYGYNGYRNNGYRYNNNRYDNRCRR